MNEPRPPFPPFTLQTALEKVQAAEDAWNTCAPHHVSLAYTPDSVWRNRGVFITGRDQIVELLTAKWQRELSGPLGGEITLSAGRDEGGQHDVEAVDGLGAGFDQVVAVFHDRA
jgi:nuclear transport factor 2 (NTF2) superfamily protein